MTPRKKKWLQEALVLLVLTAIAMTVLYPMPGSFSSRLPYAKNGDVRLVISILESNLKAVTSLNFGQIYHLPIVFPYSFTMTAGVNLFGQTLLLLPLRLLGVENVYFLYNLLTLLAFIAAGYSGYLFMREIAGGRAAAVVMAGIYTILPLRVHNIPQLNLMFNFPIPLAFLFFHRFLKNERRRDLLFFAATLLLQFLFDLSLGLFLTVGLGLYFLLHFLIKPKKRISLYAWLVLAGACTAAILVLVFHPYLDKGISFSHLTEVETIGRDAYHSALSFFSNWSSIMLALKRIIWWLGEPRSAGFWASLLFLLAFLPVLADRRQKLLYGLAAGFLLAPLILIPIRFQRIPNENLLGLAEISLGLFLAAFVVLLFLLRRRLEPIIFHVSLTWALLLFFSSQLCLGNLDPFGLLGRIVPVFRRARGIRTQYIMMLLFLAVAAYGFQRLWERLDRRKAIFSLVAVLILAERFRWPVTMEKLEDDRPAYRPFYGQLAGLPDQWGVLELPFFEPYSNHYTLYTRWHGKHTYHGLISFLNDPLQLQDLDGWSKKSGFAALGDPAAVSGVRLHGIRIIMLFKDKISSELAVDRKIWSRTLENIARGVAAGLYERVDHSRAGILLVVGGRQRSTPMSGLLPNGRNLGHFVQLPLPYFTLTASRSFTFELVADGPALASLCFNGRLLETLHLEKGEKRIITLATSRLPLARQFNHLTVVCGRPFVLAEVPAR